MNPEHHYHIRDETVGSIFICEKGSKCSRNDGYDIFGKHQGNDALDGFKLVMGFYPGQLIPISARYLTTVILRDKTTHFFEIKYSEIDKEFIFQYDNYTEKNTT